MGIAALVCAIGLVSGSPIYVTASMLLSPLMGPIQAMVLGSVTGDRAMVLKGTRNEACGVLLSLLVGVCVSGVCVSCGGIPADPGTDKALEMLHVRNLRAHVHCPARQGQALCSRPAHAIAAAVPLIGSGPICACCDSWLWLLT